MVTKNRLDVRPGDEVVIRENHRLPEIITVKRITPSGRIVIGPNHWYHPNGWAPAGDARWASTAHLSLDVDDARAERRRHNLAVRLCHVKWLKLPTELLEAVLALVDAASEE